MQPSKFALYLVLCYSLFLAACSTHTPDSDTSPTRLPASRTALAPASATPTHTPSPAPTLTHTPTETIIPTSTQTPTPALPVAANTPFPAPLEAISSENASRIRELARYGEPAIFNFDTKLSQDGRRAFASTAEGIRIYDMASRQQIGLIDAAMPRPHLRDEGYQTFLVSSDGARLGILTLQDVRIVDDQNQLLWIFPYPASIQGAEDVQFSFSPDLSLLAFAPRFGSQLEVWDSAENELVFESAGYSPLFLGDGLQLAYVNGNTGWVDIHDMATGETRTLKTNQRNSFNGFKASPDGTLLGVIGSNRVEVWNVPELKLIQLVPSLPYVRPDTLALSNNHPYLVHIENSKSINVYHLANGKRIKSVEHPGVWSILFVSLSEQGDPIVDEFLLSLGQYTINWLRTLGFNNTASALLYGADSFLLLNDSTYHACSYEFWEPVKCHTAEHPLLYDQNGQIYALVKKADENYGLYIGADEQGVLQLTIPNAPFVLPHYVHASQGHFLYSYAFGPGNDAVELWSIPEQRRRQRWAGSVQSLSISPDGHYLAMIIAKVSGNRMQGNYLIVYDLQQDRIIFREDGGYSLVVTLAFSGDSTRLLFVRPATNIYRARGLQLRVLDLQSGVAANDLLLDLPNSSHDYDSLTALALTPDRKLIAIATQAGLIRLLDPQDGSTLYEWVAHQAGISRLFFSPDGRLLVSSAIDPNIGDDGLIRVWGVLP